MGAAFKEGMWCLPVPLVTNEHITEAYQAFSKFPQCLVGDNHDWPDSPMLEVSNLQGNTHTHILLYQLHGLMHLALHIPGSA